MAIVHGGTGKLPEGVHFLVILQLSSTRDASSRCLGRTLIKKYDTNPSYRAPAAEAVFIHIRGRSLAHTPSLFDMNHERTAEKPASHDAADKVHSGGRVQMVGASKEGGHLPTLAASLPVRKERRYMSAVNPIKQISKAHPDPSPFQCIDRCP